MSARGNDASKVIKTNDWSIHAKRSVEEQFYEEPYLFHLLDDAKRAPRPAPLIDRGYYLRMVAIEKVVRRFLQRPTDRQKIVVSLGSGYDLLFFRLLKLDPTLCANAKFIDVDHHALLSRKREKVLSSRELSDLLNDLQTTFPEVSSAPPLLQSKQYVMLPCDLADLDTLRKQLTRELGEEPVSILFTAEVSIAYMDVEACDKLIAWASTTSDQASFCLLEQTLPDGVSHPFAETMLSFFEKSQTPLRCLKAYPTLPSQESRFKSLGWACADANDLWGLWCDDSFVTPEERLRLDRLQMFDEWEEFALYCSHYFLLYASQGDSDLPFIPKRLASCLSAQPFHGTPLCLSLLETPHGTTTGEPGKGFGAILKLVDGAIGLHGGVRSTRRLDGTDVYSESQASPSHLHGLPPREVGSRMFHTINTLPACGEGGGTEPLEECFLVGGRRAPGTILSDCWLRRYGKWKRMGDIPSPRYRHAAINLLKTETHSRAVLVYGGKGPAKEKRKERVLSSWAMWEEDKGWRELESSVNTTSHGSFPPPARFSMSLIPLGPANGVVLGGMSEAGVILQDLWRWSLTDTGQGLRVVMEKAPYSLGELGSPWDYLSRLGASTCVTPHGILVTGGISRDGLIPRDYEFVLWANGEFQAVGARNNSMEIPKLRQVLVTPSSPRPFLVGHSTATVSNGHCLVVGGGATCFSFGSRYNKKPLLLCDEGGSTGLENGWRHSGCNVSAALEMDNA